MKLIHLDSSALGAYSVSRLLSAEIVGALKVENPAAEIIYHDLAAEPVMHLSPSHLAAFQGGDVTDPALGADLATGGAYLQELLSADVIVIGAPMYNFSIPSQLKAWIDRVVVAGQTFKYTETGPVALTPAGKRVIIASSRGGFYTDGPAAAFDFHETYLKAVFTHIGIPDVTFVRAEGIGLGEDARNQAIEAARGEIRSLGTELREAA